MSPEGMDLGYKKQDEQVSDSANHSPERNISILSALNEDMFRRLAPTVVVLVAAMIVGAAGNILICYIFIRKLGRSSQNFLLVCLSMFDLLSSCVGIPAEIFDLRHYYLYQSQELCKAMRFITTFPSLASILVLVVIAVDRYRKICKPLHHQIHLSHARIAIILTVITALTFSVPSLYIYGHRSLPTPEPGLYGYDCSVADVYKDKPYPLVYEGVFLAAFLVFTIALAAIYLRIWLETRRHIRYLKTHATLKTALLEEATTTISSLTFEDSSVEPGIEDTALRKSSTKSLHRHPSSVRSHRQPGSSRSHRQPGSYRSHRHLGTSRSHGHSQLRSPHFTDTDHVARSKVSPGVLLTERSCKDTGHQPCQTGSESSSSNRPVVAGSTEWAEPGFIKPPGEVFELQPVRLIAETPGDSFNTSASTTVYHSHSSARSNRTWRHGTSQDVVNYNRSPDSGDLSLSGAIEGKPDSTTTQFRTTRSRQEDDSDDVTSCCALTNKVHATADDQHAESAASVLRSAHVTPSLSPENKESTSVFNHGSISRQSGVYTRQIRSGKSSLQQQHDSFDQTPLENVGVRNYGLDRHIRVDSSQIGLDRHIRVDSSQTGKNRHTLVDSLQLGQNGHTLVDSSQLGSRTEHHKCESSQHSDEKPNGTSYTSPAFDSSQGGVKCFRQSRNRKYDYQKCDLSVLKQPRALDIVQSNRASIPLHSNGGVQATDNMSSTKSRGFSSGTPARLLHHSKSNQSLTTKRVRRALRATRTTIIAFAITTGFILSYLPHLVLVILRSVKTDFEHHFDDTSLIIYNIFLRSYFANNVINVFVYGSMSREFRTQTLNVWRKFRCSKT